MIDAEKFDLLLSPLEGINFIEASAGTGKTYTLEKVFVRLLLECELPLSGILALTYTNAAAAEMRERIRSSIADALDYCHGGSCKNDFFADYFQRSEFIPEIERCAKLLKCAMLEFDNCYISTIHGFCARILGEYALESNVLFNSELEQDSSALIEQIVHDFWRENFYGGNALKVQLAHICAITVDSLFSLAMKLENIAELQSSRTPAGDDPLEQITTLLHEAEKQWPKIKKQLASIRFKGGFKPVFAPDGYELTQLYSLRYSNLENIVFKKDHPALESLREHPFIACADRVAGLVANWNLYLKTSFMAFFRRESAARKAQSNKMSFSDMLTRTAEALRNDRYGHLKTLLREKFPAALIDEFQDTDPLQYEIFRDIFVDCEKRRLFFIGDPKQAIYAFRGADVNTYLKVNESLKLVSRRYALDINYRSSTALVDEINRLFTNAENPFASTIEFRSNSAAASSKGNERELIIDPNIRAWKSMNFIHLENGSEISVIEACRDEIALLLDAAGQGKAYFKSQNGDPDKSLSCKDIAVLTATNRQSAMLQQALNARNIVSVCKGGNVFESRQTQQLEIFMRAVINCNDKAAISAALGSGIFGYSLSELHEIINAGDGVELENIFDEFSSYNKLWHDHSFVKMFKTFMLRREVLKVLAAADFPERALTNIFQLLELLGAEEFERRHSMHTLYRFLRLRRSEESIGREEYEMRLESDEAAVKIYTMHAAKGLEFPVVFCPFISAMKSQKHRSRDREFVFHHDGHRVIELALEADADAVTAFEQEKFAENMRLAYVAMTRARNMLFVSTAGNNTASPLDHLLGNADYGKLRNYCEASPDCALLPPPDTTITISSGNPERQQLNAREFNTVIDNSWQLNSFSSLVGHHDSDMLEDKQLKILEEFPFLEQSSANYANEKLPGGTTFGTMVHEIFEQTDFDAPQQEILKLCEKANFKYNQLLNAGQLPDLAVMINHTLNTNLLPGNDKLMLSSVPRSHRISEMEFHFPVSALRQDVLSRAFRQYGSDFEKDIFSKIIDRYRFIPSRGFVNGFIDLVFESGGKFYIVDWKSNLSPQQGRYDDESMQFMMLENSYLLQAAIYCRAVDRWLQGCLKNYDYQRHFGGCFYLFVRGIKEDSHNGIFFTRPQKQLIDNLMLYEKDI